MSDSSPSEDAKQNFIAHLIELRARLLKATAALFIVLVVLIPFANRLYGWLALPLIAHLPQGGTMIAIEVFSPFVTPLKLAFFAAIVIAMPVLLYQLWAFVAPGLYKREKKLAMPLLASAVGLFYVGCAFAYFLALPAVANFTAGAAPAGVAVMPDIGRYLDFALMLFLAFGLSFEVPVAIVILVAVGVVTITQLVSARRYAIVGAFVLAAILAPPDALSMALLAVPLCLLYEIGILGAGLLSRSWIRIQADTSMAE
jgi:sec-independent protein translocase protein TatC